MKKTRKTTNKILGISKCNTNKIIFLSKAGKDIYKPNEIANTFIDYFSTVSCKLISQLPPSSTKNQTICIPLILLHCFFTQHVHKK